MHDMVKKDCTRLAAQCRHAEASQCVFQEGRACAQCAGSCLEYQLMTACSHHMLGAHQLLDCSSYGVQSTRQAGLQVHKQQT